MRKEIPINIAYRLINHGPLVLVTSLFKGRIGVTPIAWLMPISDEPPIVALEIWEGHFIYKAILDTGDFVINIPSSEMADLVRKLGSVSGKKVDKVKEYNVKMEPARKINSPRVKDAIGIIECKVRKDKPLADKYNIILGDCVYAEAEKGVFSDRWHPERHGPKTIHHLRGKIFCVPDSKII